MYLELVIFSLHWKKKGSGLNPFAQMNTYTNIQIIANSLGASS